MSFFNESMAEMAFRQAGPMLHLYTKPLETEVFFDSDDERKVAVNYLAIAVKQSKCNLLAYAIMTNHFHFILEGREVDTLAFYDCFRRLMDNYFQHHGKGAIMKIADPGLTAINNLAHLRNEIAYVLRNPFVVLNTVNVFAYPWTSGNLYFNPLLTKSGKPASKYSMNALREMTKTRTLPPIDESIYFEDGVAQPWSFVDYKYVEGFYDNARQFIFSILKNVEGQIETAVSYGEIPSLSDEELLPHVYKLCRQKMKAESPSALDEKGKKQLAVMVKNAFYSSNKQIARLLKINLATVNDLFPLSAPSSK